MTPLVGLAQIAKLPSRSIYKNVQELKLVESLSWKSINQQFSFGNGRVSYVFQLDSLHRFKYLEFGDVMTITLDEGIWRIKKRNILFLKSRTIKRYFDVVMFDNFVFYISKEQRTGFVDDFKNEQINVSYYKMKVADPRYTKNFFIAFNLMRKYYGTELVN